LVAALETSRSGIGFEIVKKYADIARGRVKDALTQNAVRWHTRERIILDKDSDS